MAGEQTDDEVAADSPPAPPGPNDYAAWSDWAKRIEDRLADGQSRFRHVDDRLADQAVVLRAQGAQLREQGTALKQHGLELKHNTEKTEEMLAIVGAVKGGFRVLGWLGNLAQVLWRVGAPIAALWGLIHAAKNGTPPK